MKFAPTDQVVTISDEQREIARKHEGHDPRDHICEDCLDTWEDWCWAKQHGYDEPVHDENAMNPAPVEYRSETDCKCECHHLFWECTLSQAALENEGKPYYRLEGHEEDPDKYAVMVPCNLVEKIERLEDEEE